MFSFPVTVLFFTILLEFRIHKPMDIGLLDILCFYSRWIPRNLSLEGIPIVYIYTFVRYFLC